MNKNTNSSEKAQYVTPSCKAVELQLNAILCQSNEGFAAQSLWDDNDDETQGWR